MHIYIEGIHINLPTKQQYVLNRDNLDLNGGIINVIYENGDNTEKSFSLNLNSDDVKVTGFNNTSLCSKTLEVSYKGFSTTFDVKVVETITTTETMEVNVTNGEANYDGNPTNGGAKVSVIKPTSGATIKYGTKNGVYDLNNIPTYIDIGVYTVYYEITATGYETKTGSFTITIKQNDLPKQDVTAPTISFENEEKIQNGIKVTVKVEDMESNIAKIKVAKGTQNVQYFENERIKIPITTPGKVQQATVNITESGLYTIYAEDMVGNKVIQEINITVKEIQDVFGDLDMSGQADETYLEILKRYIASGQKVNIENQYNIIKADMNGDGNVDLVDLYQFKKQF